MMQMRFQFPLILVLFAVACSTGKQWKSEPVAVHSLVQPISNFVAAMNASNCTATVPALRSYLESLDLSKYKLDRELQNHLFQMRLNIKHVFAEGVNSQSESLCTPMAKQALVDLRTLDESLGFQLLPASERSPASSSVSPASLFTDSHRQLVANKYRDDGVSSLMDLKTADILLLHRSGTQPLLEQTGADWTDVLVVFRDNEGEIYFFFAHDKKVLRRGWYQASDWIKRSASRLHVLRPIDPPSGDTIERLQNRVLKNPYAFGDLIKKEFKLKAASTALPGVGDVVLGMDLELSPSLVSISEWKDYSAAYNARVISQQPAAVPAPNAIQRLPDNLLPKSPQRSYLDEKTVRGTMSY